MEKKDIKTRLRLVTTDETMGEAQKPVDVPETAQLHSKFAQQMNTFADDLDRMIDLILRS